MEERSQHLSIMIAAGGTGGHLFPAQALATELIEKYPSIEITFVGAGLRNNDYFKKEAFPFLDIKSETPRKKHPWKLVKALFTLLQGTCHSFLHFSKKKPDMIIGFGSYHTFPALLAAKLRKVPIVIFESNVFPGKVNRYCSKWAQTSAIQFSQAASHLKSKSVAVHMPLIKKGAVSRKEARHYFGLDGETLTLLVFGGSQGAQSINRFFCAAIEELLAREIDFQVIHIVGEEKRAEKLEAYYQKMGVKAAIKSFEEKMECAWSAADISISRSGAATLAELIEFCVPSILIPYPYGAERHQQKNATFLSSEVKGAVVLDEKTLCGPTLAKEILSLIDNEKETLKQMRRELYGYKEKETKQDLSSIVLKLL